MKTTEELLNEIKSSHDVIDYLGDNQKELRFDGFKECLAQWLKAKNLTKAQVIRGANVSKHYAYQIFSGRNTPSRDKVIALSFGLNMNVDETQILIKQAGYRELYPRDVRDSLILYAIAQKMSVDDANILLLDHDELVLE